MDQSANAWLSENHLCCCFVLQEDFVIVISISGIRPYIKYNVYCMLHFYSEIFVFLWWKKLGLFLSSIKIKELALGMHFIFFSLCYKHC